MTESVIIVGAGQTAAVAARTLRRRGLGGRITVVGEEAVRPYQRPPLSKDYLSGREGEDGLWLLTEDWCDRNEVGLRLGAHVRKVHRGSRSVELADGTLLEADALLVATGTRPRRLPGVEGERVRYLRTLADANRLGADLRPGAHVLVIGAGFIGAEVASTARELGASVTVLERADHPLGHVLGRRMGEVCAALQREHGVDLRTGETVEKYMETADAAVVTTTAGRAIEADVVVIAVGVVPNVEPLIGSGVELNNGVVVDEHCRTGVAGVFAAGDVARHYHPLFERHLRVEHFDNANGQGMAAAKNILGERIAYTAPHWFWSDQFGRNLQHVGHGHGCDEIVVRGQADSFDFTAFYLHNGVLRAAFAVDRGGDIAVARQMISARAMPDPAGLRDENVDLADLSAATH
ncbi:NAD(P)/FAD-dependent oxidoreductase [Sinosporangium siamense]|uniref:Pyridine nucleotide-disulfide oxidoreductase n=1 Tax=Sinosporangium siamense TaxID=1367973 RepID=A0A919V4V4_9ACTN|nr:FAD-dependent oxidoreductase [Sinosporangium siamense]GII92325.1 pyridine nucleotide-disulfide oxidoreductase [Sinosporangium siamense]